MAKNTSLCDKMIESLDVLENKMQEHKKHINGCRIELKSIRKQLAKMMQKQDKIDTKQKKERKPHGFARPTVVSDELCSFMGKEKGSLVSRTEVTKFLIQYIADNNLQNPENRRNILVDAKLKSLFGPESENEKIDYFNMQKFVNRHFPKKE
jgi:upstream activation factor subunit UAF30